MDEPLGMGRFSYLDQTKIFSHYFTTALLKSFTEDLNAIAEEPNSVVKLWRIPPLLAESLKSADHHIAAYCNNDKPILEQSEEPRPLVQPSFPLETASEQSEHSITDEDTLVDTRSECVGSTPVCNNGKEI